MSRLSHPQRRDATRGSAVQMIFLALLAYRIVTALLVSTTYLQPDAEWQGLEIAHRLVFGYGYVPWEWRSEHALRSPIGALVYVPAFGLAKLLGGSPTIVVRDLCSPS